MNPDRHTEQNHELSDVETRPLWFSALSILIGCILIGAGTLWMFYILKYRLNSVLEGKAMMPPSIIDSRERFPAPRLQPSPAADFAQFRAREDQELNSYGWIDKDAGIVRIPVERAIDLLVARGLPERDQPGVSPPYRTELDLQKARAAELKPVPTPASTP